MIDCRTVSTLVATGTLSEQPVRLRLQVWLHALVCRYCRRFWRQVRALDRGVQAALRSFDEDLPRDLAARIAARLSRPT